MLFVCVRAEKTVREFILEKREGDLGFRVWERSAVGVEYERRR